jgi:hypothetical protein
MIEFESFLEQLDYVRRTHALQQWMWRATSEQCRMRVDAERLRDDSEAVLRDVVAFVAASSSSPLASPLPAAGLPLPAAPRLDTLIANYYSFIGKLKLIEPDLVQYLQW